ncbi:MAG: TIR domain-containing protein [Pseudonocardiaceae bacterium]
MARVFISYAYEDLARARDVHGWLVEANHTVFLDQDPNEGIVVGEAWRQRLHERLRWADAVVCVVTSASVASTWCTAEVTLAQERGSRLLPLFAEPKVDHPLLTDIQHIDLVQDSAAAQAALIAALRRIDAAGGSGWPDGRSPFPGLRPFEIDQHRVFLGRTDETKALAEQVRSAAEGTALLVLGPSGCGKSSLVRAGLLPVMADEPGWRTLPPIVPGADPVAALARELAAASRRISLDWTVEHVHQRLDATRGLVGLVDELLLADPDGPQRRLLVVVDQFEELLTQTAPTERARLAELLHPALTGPVQVVGTLRPEFLDQLLADPYLVAVPTDMFPLRPLQREALRLVIEGPAQLAGIGVDADLVVRLVNDTATGEALPLLAFTLAQLAKGVSRGGQLSTTCYDQLGGVSGALTRQADAALAEAISAGGRHREEVIAGLLRLVTVDEEGHPTRWRITRAELTDQVITELDAFVARRLLTTDADNGTVVIGVAHEAFLSAWPPLAEAITQNATALRARRAVEQAATEWDDHGRLPARLWGGGQLAAAVTDTGARIGSGNPSAPRRRGPARLLPRPPRVLDTDRVDLSPQARDFLHAGVRHDRYRRRRLVTILSVLLTLALVGAGVAVIQQGRAQEQERVAQDQLRVATARQLIAQADTLLDSDPRTALRLGLAAENIYPGGETRAALFDLVSTTRYAGSLAAPTGPVGPERAVAFASEGRLLATGSNDDAVILWDLTDPDRPRQLGRPLTAHSNAVRSMAFAPHGHVLATAGIDEDVILWNVTDPARPQNLGQPLTAHNDDVNSVAFAPDGQTLATASSDNTVILWDVTDPAQPRQLGQPLTAHTTEDVVSVAFAPDRPVLASASKDDTVILWDVTDPARPQPLGQPLTAHNDDVHSVAFAPDGQTLATASTDNTVILWDVTDPARPKKRGQPLTAHGNPVCSVAFAPDGQTLATASTDDRVILWNVADPAGPQPLGQPLPADTDAGCSVAFTPDGQMLATATDDTVILWDIIDLAGPQPLGQPLTDHAPEDVVSATFAHDQPLLATASSDNTAILWDVTNPAQPQKLGQSLAAHAPEDVVSATFAHDQPLLATASSDNTAILWNITNPAAPRELDRPLTAHTDDVRSVAFAPNRPLLATASRDHTVILWSITNAARPRPLGQPLTVHSAGPFSVAFSRNGRILATATDDTVILWDITNPAEPRSLGQTLPAPTGAVSSVAFAPDGRTLATISNDTVILWDVTDPARPQQLGQPLSAHSNIVRSVAFAPDGHTLATAGNDDKVILWDLTDPAQAQPLGQPLISHTQDVRSVAFSPDGNTLATAGDDDKVILWDLTGLNRLRDHTTEYVCAIARGGPDENEWRRYIVSLSYRDTC